MRLATAVVSILRHLWIFKFEYTEGISIAIYKREQVIKLGASIRPFNR